MDYIEVNKATMFFIVGRARSGTTLLQTMLDAHPSVIVPGESCILMHLKNKYFYCSQWDNKTVNDFLSDILQEKKLKQFWNLDLDKIKSQILLIPESSRNYVLLCKILYLNYPSIFKQNEVSVIGDKNPIYTIFIHDLIELFPQAKFIHIVRDYRANIASNREAFSLKNIATLAHAWKYNNKKVDQAIAKYPDRFLTVKYEDISIDPVKEMKLICEFLNIIYTPSIFDYHEVINEQIDDKAKVIFNKLHVNLLKPVNSDSINSWKQKLSKSEISLAEFITGNHGLKYGYPLTTPRVNSIQNYLKSFCGTIRNQLIYTTIKIYYYSPLYFKNILGICSSKINKWFNLKNYFNQTDFV